MDEEKDIYIKSKLQEDKFISKKADDIFDSISKGEFFMEENPKKQNVTEEKFVNVKRKNQKWKKILATAACLVIVVGVANVYATSQGYENIFFMIKYLVTGEGNIEGKENILSDRDITISYEPISIAKDLNVIVKKLQVKDNQAKLHVISIEKGEVDKSFLPLKFVVYNIDNEKLCEQISTEDLKLTKSVTDELILHNFKESDNIIKLEICGANSDKLAILEINLVEKTVEVQGEKEALQKISEIELKKFLGYAAGLSNKANINENELEIALAIELLESNPSYNAELVNNLYYIYPTEKINEVLESFIGKQVENFDDGKYIKTVNKNGKKYYRYTEGGDNFYSGECINISNISYCNGVYTVNYTYYYRGVEPDEDVNMNNYDIYEQEICIKLNDDDTYSMFKVVSMEEPTIIEKAKENNSNDSEEAILDNKTSNNDQTITNTNTNSTNLSNTNTNNTDNTNTSNEKIDNYASTMSWKEYWAPCIKFQYPTIFKLEEVGGEYRGSYQNEGKVSTKISGIAVGVDPDTKARIDSDLEIRVYQPLYTTENVDKYKYDENGREKSKFTTSNGLVWYESKEGEFGKDYTEIYTCVEYFHDGTWTIFKIEFETKGEYNYKVRNITNWLMGSTKLTNW